MLLTILFSVPLGIFPTPKTIIVRPGENAFLHCQAYGSPQPSVSWSRYKNNAVISISDGRFFVFKNGTLIIYNVREEDKDVYVCVASNGVSSPAQRILKLEIRGKTANKTSTQITHSDTRNRKIYIIMFKHLLFHVYIHVHSVQSKMKVKLKQILIHPTNGGI